MLLTIYLFNVIWTVYITVTGQPYERWWEQFGEFERDDPDGEGWGIDPKLKAAKEFASKENNTIKDSTVIQDPVAIKKLEGIAEIKELEVIQNPSASK